ncbi:hypothetical protein [Chryseobacterium oranimense]|uniref:hypothetical protein n=1 Tax=Chryseobacterium oranimense TaxID=421058 RepID=UPI001E396E15|nr:hypothetical protein [Chryseobacterium oranimense]
MAHSAGAGEVLTGVILLIGVDIMTLSGVAVTDTHIGAAATGVTGTDLFTEEAVAEDSVIRA